MKCPFSHNNKKDERERKKSFVKRENMKFYEPCDTIDKASEKFNGGGGKITIFICTVKVLTFIS
jgi:hypothetical protein